MCMNRKVIAIDFDGTCVTHAFPRIGHDIGAVPVLKELALRHDLILYTMRSDISDPTSNIPTIICSPGDYLSWAIEWLRDRDIPIVAANENPDQKTWTTSPKVYADYYIDDSAIGTPLRFDRMLSDRPFVDWTKMKDLLRIKGLI